MWKLFFNFIFNYILLVFRESNLYILYSVTLLTSYRNRWFFFWLFDFFFIMTSENNDSFTSFFPSIALFFSLPYSTGLEICLILMGMFSIFHHYVYFCMSLISFIYQVKQVSFYFHFTESFIFSQCCQDDCRKSTLLYMVYINSF